jgi:hypothetical protein
VYGSRWVLALVPLLLGSGTLRIGCDCEGGGARDAGPDDGGAGDGGTQEARPSLALADPTTGSTSIATQPTVDVTIANDASAAAWCLSEAQTSVPASASVPCTGGEGPDHGWSTARPATFTLSSCDRLKQVSLWLALPDGGVSTAGATAAIQLQTDVTTGLKGWWKFDEQQGTTAADSAGGNPGTLINGPIWAVGHLGGALSFDGLDDRVDLADAGTIYATQAAPFSFSAWFNLSDFTMTVPDLMQMRSDSDLPFHVLLSVLPAYQGVSAGSGAGPWLPVRTGVVPTTAAWHHVVMVFDGADAGATTSFMIFLDGVSQPVMAAGAYGLQVNQSRIGAAEDVTTNQWKGLIDDVRVYGRALSAAEVQRLFALCY